MPRIVPTNHLGLVARALSTLGLSYRKAAGPLGSSQRTIQRWFSGGSSPSVEQIVTLAKLVYPHDPALSAALAAEAMETPVSLGLVAPPPPPAPPAQVAPAPSVPVAFLVDSIVCVAAETMGLAPAALRPSLYAAFKRARELGLDIAGAERALQGSLASAGSAPD
jgi:hypothetical protein